MFLKERKPEQKQHPTGKKKTKPPTLYFKRRKK
jgi:hypothetical protein